MRAAREDARGFGAHLLPPPAPRPAAIPPRTCRLVGHKGWAQDGGERASLGLKIAPSQQSGDDADGDAGERDGRDLAANR